MAFNIFRRPEEDYFSSFNQPVEQRGISPSPVAQDLLTKPRQLEPIASHVQPESSGPMGPTKIGPTTLPGSMGRTKIGPEPMSEMMPQMTAADARPLEDWIMSVGGGGGLIGSLDDVAARMGKPLGSFRSELTPDTHYGGYKLRIHDDSPGTRNYLESSEPSVAGYIRLGEPGAQGYLPVDMTYLSDTYRNKGMGGEMYQEALKRVKEAGFKGLASDPGMRNQFSNQVWDRPGITRVGTPPYNLHDLMSEYIPRGKDWEGSTLKNMFNLDKTTQPMLPEVKDWLLDQMKNKPAQPAPVQNVTVGTQRGVGSNEPHPLVQMLIDQMRIR